MNKFYYLISFTLHNFMKYDILYVVEGVILMNRKINEFVGSRIKDIRKKRGFTQKELGLKLGVKHNTISSYEKGTNEPEQDILFRMADALDVSINDFFPYKDKVISLPSSDYPHLPAAISAGLPINVDGVTTSETITLPDSVMGKWAGNKDILISSIYGDSMDKIMPDGSLIAIKPINLEELKNGDIVVFSANGEYSIKYYFKHGDKL